MPFRGLTTLVIVLGFVTAATPRVIQAMPVQTEAVAEHSEGATEVEQHDAAHTGGSDHSSSKNDQNILAIQPTLATYTLLVFVILLGVLWRFAWGPLSKALEEREHRMQHAFEEAEKTRADAASLLEQHKAQMGQAHEQVRALIEEARRDAQSTADSIVKRAQDEAEAARNRAQREIGIAKDEALMDIWSQSADLAVTVAHRVLERELSPADHKRLVEIATQQIPAHARSASGRGGAQG